jgi:hypothetical protein
MEFLYSGILSCVVLGLSAGGVVCVLVVEEFNGD